ncbi:cation transporter [Aeromicrobium sp. A1-2]|uniref:cation:proton antiporter n=1 Tax=Aeromicrobium sp. A1-2 TaxID=2107713 RepID=UPI000E4DB6A2|nr:cation:proton antiporter [Aeromicrobium sp. A1-2]AXT86091.1 cation transporter [Aeromicrobium sp. A1-2]
MTAHLVYLLGGASLFLAVVLPYALRSAALSAPVVLLAVGALIGLLPNTDGSSFSPIEHRLFVEHLAEFTVLIALMGVGLALDRPLSLRSLAPWRRWGATWRLLGVAMPLSIAAVALLGWWAMGLAPSAALLLGAVLAPTDPVLASDVQVEGPTTGDGDENQIDETDEVRFALTSEAGLNDGLAFPFVHAAILLAATGPVTEWGASWLAWDLVGKVVVGSVLGIAVGWLLAKAAFGSTAPSLRTSESGEPLLAIAAVLLSYGLAEVAGGYGFLAVFACAMTLRSAERGSEYHALMHQVVERLERLLTLIILLLLGVALTNGLLSNLTWPAVLVSVSLLLVIRPAAGMLALSIPHPWSRARVGDATLGARERAAAAFFGVRGIGSIYYLAYATGQADFERVSVLWSTVGLTITLSVILHGVSATPVMRWLDARRDDAAY